MTNTLATDSVGFTLTHETYCAYFYYFYGDVIQSHSHQVNVYAQTADKCMKVLYIIFNSQNSEYVYYAARDAAVKEWTRRPRYIFYTYGTQCTGGGEAKVTTRKKKKKRGIIVSTFLCVFVVVSPSFGFFFFLSRVRDR